MFLCTSSTENTLFCDLYFQVCVLRQNRNNKIDFFLRIYVFFAFHFFACLFVFLQGIKNGVPADVCHPAASDDPGNVVHSHHGEGSDQVWYLMLTWTSVLAVPCIVPHFSSQSWWEWGGLENSDLWYNCRFDNFTETWLCASSKETGTKKTTTTST